MRKGQVFTWDLIFGLVVFMVTLSIAFKVWADAYDDLRYAEQEYEMNWLAETVSDQLVRTSGQPHNWTLEDIGTFGLVEVRGKDLLRQSRVLDADKLLYLIKSFDENYTWTRGNLLGTSRYDLYLRLSCLNSTGLTCLQGLELDTVSSSVDCNNQRIKVRNGYTTVYNFKEAEDLWGYHDDSMCTLGIGCSKDNMSLVPDDEHATIYAHPGEYVIWARLLDNPSSNAKIIFNGQEYSLNGNGIPGFLGWARISGPYTQEFSGNVRVSFEDTATDRVDALLLTTDLFYDPSTENIPTYGNPNVDNECVMGKLGLGSDAISAKRTALLGRPLSDEEFFEGVNMLKDEVLEITTVVYRGVSLTPRSDVSGSTSSSTSTSSGSGQSLACVGSPIENCVSNNPSTIGIDDVTLLSGGVEDNTIICDQNKQFTVSWNGRHAGTPNYFGFFLDDDDHFIGSCESDNTGSEIVGTDYNYDMSCDIPVPAASTMNLGDGSHTLIVTGEDFAGYCNTTDTDQDDRFQKTVQVSGCVNYDALTCTPQSSPSWQCISGADTVEQIYSISQSAMAGPTNQIVCGVDNDFTVRWRGTHGTDDDRVQWTYLLRRDDGTYACLGTCRSERADGTDPVDYDMSCTFDLTTDCYGAQIDGFTAYVPYQLYVVAESNGGRYCREPGSLLAEAVQSELVTTINCDDIETTAVLNYYVPDFTGTTSGAEIYTTTLGGWDPTPVYDGNVGYAELTMHSEIITGLTTGSYRWNVKLFPAGINPPDDDFLYSTNQSFIIS